MADNDKDTKDTSARQTEDAQPDYDKMMPRQPTGTTVGDSMSTDRDLGTVGGGTVPNGGNVGSGKSPGGPSTSSSAVEGGGTSGGGNVGAGSTTGRGGMTNEDITQKIAATRLIAMPMAILEGAIPQGLKRFSPRWEIEIRKSLWVSRNLMLPTR